MDNDLTIFERGSSFFPTRLAEALDRVPVQYRDMEASELEKIVKPSPVIKMLQVAFNRELERATRTGKQFSTKRVYEDICSAATFSRMIDNPAELAYVTKKIPQYEVAIESVLMDAAEKYREIINLPIRRKVSMVTKSGEVVENEIIDAKLAAVVISAIKNLEDRIHGKSLQKNINITTNQPEVRDNEQAFLDKETIDKKIKELEESLKKSGGVLHDTTIDVDYRMVDKDVEDSE